MTPDRIVDYTITTEDAAALNHTVSVGDVYPVLVVGRTETDDNGPGMTYGHLLLHHVITPFSFITPEDKPAEPAAGSADFRAVPASEPAPGVTLADIRAADTPPAAPGAGDAPLQQMRETALGQQPNVPQNPGVGQVPDSAASVQPEESRADFEARIRREVAAEHAATQPGTVTGSEGRL